MSATDPEPGAGTLAEMVRARLVSPRELVEDAFGAIESLDDDLNCHTALFPEQALAEAEQAEAAVMRGDRVGPLCGVPFSVKDVTWVKGAPATNGCVALVDFIAPADAVVVQRMRAAGGVLVGKTNNPEFCLRGVTENGIHGVTRNPWDLSRTPGGSSGGAAAAVSAQMTPVALGSDGGGSIRIPSSFCGTWGFKPSFGRVPEGPGHPGWPTLTVNGPLARSARDLALVDGVLAGAHPFDYQSLPARPPEPDRPMARSIRVAASVDLGSAPVEPDVRSAFEQSLTRFADAGWEIEEDVPATPNPNDLWTKIAVCEGFSSHRNLLEEQRDRLSPDSIEILEPGEGYTASDYLDAMHERADFARTWGMFFERYEALVTPSMQLTAFPLGIKSPTHIDGHRIDPFYDDWCTFCLPANLVGLPAASVPNGLDRHGLPIGLQIMAPRFRDDLVLRLAAEWEAIAPPAGVPPLIRDSHR